MAAESIECNIASAEPSEHGGKTVDGNSDANTDEHSHAMLASSDGADSLMLVDKQHKASRTTAHDDAEPDSARPQERGGQPSKQRRGALRA